MKKYFVLLLVVIFAQAGAQQSLPVTDSLPAMLDGIQAGYSITDASEKEVGNKGNFSRYKLRFYVTNTAQEAKIFYTKPAFFNGSPSNTLVRFMCANATGARLTNKEASIQMQPATIMADVEDKDCSNGKTVINRRPVNIGYWIQPGETISANTIMITPLGEKPAVTAVYYPNTGTQAGVLLPQQNMPQQQAENFVHIKNFANGNYLQLEQGPLQCSPIDMGWWSAQWEVLPVNGSKFFVIKNRYRNNFLALDNNGIAYMAPRADAVTAMWTVEQVGASGTFSIRSAANDAKLVIQNNTVKAMNQFTQTPGSQWIIAP